MVRFKNRYVLVEVTPVARAGGRTHQLQQFSGDAVHCAMLARAIKDSILANFGELGTGLTSSMHGEVDRSSTP